MCYFFKHFLFMFSADVSVFASACNSHISPQKSMKFCVSPLNTLPENNPGNFVSFQLALKQTASHAQTNHSYHLVLQLPGKLLTVIWQLQIYDFLHCERLAVPFSDPYELWQWFQYGASVLLGSRSALLQCLLRCSAVIMWSQILIMFKVMITQALTCVLMNVIVPSNCLSMLQMWKLVQSLPKTPTGSSMFLPTDELGFHFEFLCKIQQSQPLAVSLITLIRHTWIHFCLWI